MKWINENWKGLLVVAVFVYVGWTIYNGLEDNRRASSPTRRSLPDSMKLGGGVKLGGLKIGAGH